MGRTREKDLDATVRALTEERVNGTLPVEQQLVDPGMSQEDVVTDLISHVPANQGYYFKLYKKFPVPERYGNRPMFLMDIPQPELLQDLEVELSKLAQKYGWTDGIYEFMLYKHGEPKVMAQRTITIAVPAVQVPPPGVAQVPAQDPMQTIAQVAKLIKDLTPAGPGPQGTVDAPSIVKAVTEAYTKGAEAAARTAPPPANDIAPLIMAIKSLIPTPPPQPTVDPITVIKELRHVLQPAAQQTSDPLDAMAKMLTVLLPLIQRPEPVDQTAKLLETLTAILPLVQGGKGESEPASPLVEAVRLLAPQASKMTGDLATIVTSVVNKGSQPSGPQPTTLPPQAQAQVQVQKEESPMLPIFGTIRQAAEANDQAFYPQMEELLERVTTPDQMDQILSGSMPPDIFLDQVAKWGGPFFNGPIAKAYFTNFVDWKKAQMASLVLAKCPKCGDEFEMTSKDEVEQGAPCPTCNVNLTLVASPAATV